MSSTVTLSAFGDEIAPDLATQLTLLADLNVRFLEFRSAWGKNIKDLSDEELHTAHRLCDEQGIGVSCLGSPIGKTPIQDPFEHELAILERMFQVGDILGTRFIRVFSFYPPKGANPQLYLDDSIQRLAQLTGCAAQAGFTLLLENDEELIGSTIENLHAILNQINSPHLRHAWDGANFVSSGVEQPTSKGWERLSPFLGVVHVKDFRTADHTRRAAGEGDAQLLELFQHLKTINYQGFLAIEPHPYHVDGRGSIGGAVGMTYAVKACRHLLEQLNLLESPSLAE